MPQQDVKKPNILIFSCTQLRRRLVDRADAFAWNAVRLQVVV